MRLLVGTLCYNDILQPKEPRQEVFCQVNECSGHNVALVSTAAVLILGNLRCPASTDKYLIHSRDFSNVVVGQVVFIVVDALRADFVFPASKLAKFGLNIGGQDGDDRPKMDFVTQLIDAGDDAVAFVARAHAPTVTLPRIKVNCFSVLMLYHLAEMGMTRIEPGAAG